MIEYYIIGTIIMCSAITIGAVIGLTNNPISKYLMKDDLPKRSGEKR